MLLISPCYLLNNGLQNKCQGRGHPWCILPRFFSISVQSFDDTLIIRVPFFTAIYFISFHFFFIQMCLSQVTTKHNRNNNNSYKSNRFIWHWIIYFTTFYSLSWSICSVRSVLFGFVMLCCVVFLCQCCRQMKQYNCWCRFAVKMFWFYFYFFFFSIFVPLFVLLFLV